ncbi:MAG: hypothetical protein WBP12_00665 [Candidatus Saccharimonas sp.]
MATIINLTPHVLVLLVEDAAGEVVGSVGFGRGARTARFRVIAELPSEGVARAATSVRPAGTVEVSGHVVSVTRTVFGEVQDLPEPQGGVRLVISLITANAAAAAGRTTDDLLVVGESVRDEGGKIIGVTGFGAV